MWRSSDKIGDLLQKLVGGFKHGWIIFHFIYGMSSFPLTNSYFSRWLLHHQPERILWFNFIVCVARHAAIRSPKDVEKYHKKSRYGDLAWGLALRDLRVGRDDDESSSPSSALSRCLWIEPGQTSQNGATLVISWFITPLTACGYIVS